MVNYDFYKNPPKKGWHGKQRLHARVVSAGTVDTDSLARFIHDCSTLTVGEAKAALSAFIDGMKMELSSGRRVHLEGLGYFQLTLDCPVIYERNEIRAESIKVKSIVFRPDVQFKKEFKNLLLRRKPEKRHSRLRSEKEVDRLLTAYFSNHPYMTGREFRQLCGFTKSTAYRWVKRLVTGGKLQAKGHANSPFYEPGKGWYGK